MDQLARVVCTRPCVTTRRFFRPFDASVQTERTRLGNPHESRRSRSDERGSMSTRHFPRNDAEEQDRSVYPFARCIRLRRARDHRAAESAHENLPSRRGPGRRVRPCPGRRPPCPAQRRVRATRSRRTAALCSVSRPRQRHVTAATRRLVVLVHSVLWPLALAALAGFRSVPEAQRQVGRRSAPASTVSGSAVALSESTTCAMEKSRQSRR